MFELPEVNETEVEILKEIYKSATETRFITNKRAMESLITKNLAFTKMGRLKPARTGSDITESVQHGRPGMTQHEELHISPRGLRVYRAKTEAQRLQQREASHGRAY